MFTGTICGDQYILYLNANRHPKVWHSWRHASGSNYVLVDWMDHQQAIKAGFSLSRIVNNDVTLSVPTTVEPLVSLRPLARIMRCHSTETVQWWNVLQDIPTVSARTSTVVQCAWVQSLSVHTLPTPQLPYLLLAAHVSSSALSGSSLKLNIMRKGGPVATYCNTMSMDVAGVTNLSALCIHRGWFWGKTDGTTQDRPYDAVSQYCKTLTFGPVHHELFVHLPKRRLEVLQQLLLLKPTNEMLVSKAFAKITTTVVSLRKFLCVGRDRNPECGRSSGMLLEWYDDNRCSSWVRVDGYFVHFVAVLCLIFGYGFVPASTCCP